MNIKSTIILLVVAMFAFSCGKGKQSEGDGGYTDPSSEYYTDNDSSWESERYEDNDVIEVTFARENGSIYIPVMVNGLGFVMCLDTGCSSILLSRAEFNYMWEKGLITDEDILGERESELADGSIVKFPTVRLKLVAIGNENNAVFLSDVEACIANDINADMLIGTSVLNRLTSYEIDNTRNVIRFKTK